MLDLRAPFPYFGGKSRVAHLVWDRFGEVANYVEPFFGSGAVLLGRPKPSGIETVNDLDCMVANFWRALQHDPLAVASFADWPVNEADLHARHLWLRSRDEFRERMKSDPDYYDANIAGWWVWGLCAWIGSRWCSTDSRQLPQLGSSGRGVHRKITHLGNYMRGLAERLRGVRVCCGDWRRVVTPAVTERNGMTGVLLDPPYGDVRRHGLYGEDSLTVAAEVREWAIANQDNPLLRIALCGYEGDHDMPSSWHVVAWKAHGGYGSQGDNKAKENCRKERIWFSPHCLRPQQESLFTHGQS